MSDFIPNSFQTPNAYVDQFLCFLTGEEWKVLSYTARKILGFHKRQDRISLSQYEKGTFARDGRRLDYGTGLSVPAISAALSSLTKFRLMIKVADNDPKLNEGTCWALQLDSAQVDWDALMERHEQKHRKGQARTSKARAIKAARADSTGDDPGDDDPPDPSTPPFSPTTGGGVQSDYMPPFSPTTGGGVQSDYTPLNNATIGTPLVGLKHKNQVKNQVKTTDQDPKANAFGNAADAAGPGFSITESDRELIWATLNQPISQIKSSITDQEKWSDRLLDELHATEAKGKARSGVFRSIEEEKRRRSLTWVYAVDRVRDLDTALALLEELRTDPKLRVHGNQTAIIAALYMVHFDDRTKRRFPANAGRLGYLAANVSGGAIMVCEAIVDCATDTPGDPHDLIQGKLASTTAWTGYRGNTGKGNNNGNGGDERGASREAPTGTGTAQQRQGYARNKIGSARTGGGLRGYYANKDRFGDNTKAKTGS